MELKPNDQVTVTMHKLGRIACILLVLLIVCLALLPGLRRHAHAHSPVSDRVTSTALNVSISETSAPQPHSIDAKTTPFLPSGGRQTGFLGENLRESMSMIRSQVHLIYHDALMSFGLTPTQIATVEKLIAQRLAASQRVGSQSALQAAKSANDAEIQSVVSADQFDRIQKMLDLSYELGTLALNHQADFVTHGAALDGSQEMQIAAWFKIIYTDPSVAMHGADAYREYRTSTIDAQGLSSPDRALLAQTANLLSPEQQMLLEDRLAAATYNFAIEK